MVDEMVLISKFPPQSLERGNLWPPTPAASFDFYFLFRPGFVLFVFFFCIFGAKRFGDAATL